MFSCTQMQTRIRTLENKESIPGYSTRLKTTHPPSVSQFEKTKQRNLHPRCSPETPSATETMSKFENFFLQACRGSEKPRCGFRLPCPACSVRSAVGKQAGNSPLIRWCISLYASHVRLTTIPSLEIPAKIVVPALLQKSSLYRKLLVISKSSTPSTTFGQYLQYTKKVLRKLQTYCSYCRPTIVAIGL